MAGLLVIMMTAATATAQRPGVHFHEKMEQIRAHKVAFITDRLNLTPGEAQAFWPLYNDFEAKRDEMVASFREKFDYTPEDVAEMADDKALEFVNAYLDHEQHLLDLRKDLHNQLKEVMPPKKILMLIGAEKEFKRELLRKVGGMEGPPRGSHPRSGW
ncbi:MAG: hypothetical protein JW861_05215 [Bacteroidales bacterium]|nr:hypothetical protein [Bacteroidales bacterium]